MWCRTRGTPAAELGNTTDRSGNSLEILQKGGKTFEVYVDNSHFRKGSYGEYKQTLPQHIIADIEERFHVLQRRWGYA